MQISNNIVAIRIMGSMRKTNSKLESAMEKLSSGSRINSLKDDAAGFAISNKLDRQIQGMNRASMNSMDGVSIVQTADGALSQIHDMLQRIRELAVEASNDTLSDSDKEKVNAEVTDLTAEIHDTTIKTDYNGIKLLSGQASRMAVDASPTNVNVNYISNNVPSGTLKYNITSVGTSATLSTGYVPTSAVTNLNGTIAINGATIAIVPTDTSADIYAKIQQASTDAGITIDATGGNAVFTTLDEGSTTSIAFTGDPAILGALGLTTTTATGTDAVISGITLIKPDGVTPDPTFNSSISTVINGNNIKITSNNNQEVDITAKGVASTSSQITDYGQIILQVGANKGSELGLYIPKVDDVSLGIQNVNISTRAGAQRALNQMDYAISRISKIRADLGADENRLQYTTKALDVNSTSTQQSLSRIKDTDMAMEMTEYTKQNVIYQAATSILAQANQRPQQILQLLK